jgi:hypothetical protein
VQNYTAHKLHIEMAQPYSASGRLPDRGKGLWQKVIQRLAFRQPFLKFDSLNFQVFIGQFLELWFKGIYLRD